ncbi:40s ribosomal protein s10b [Lasallia pustulata]|uniref:40s ribosomal protein s10b n=1 Tax=Lasallia pustulata TaxID=136370 RepID=A0A1W5CYF0_9LECA|nr:40s ribosomal protein s10b [Lasallia pustulata]
MLHTCTLDRVPMAIPVHSTEYVLSASRLYRFPELRQELAIMLIPKADRKKIHEYLFREGVLVAKKDFNLPKHNEIDTKNLYVVKACQSLTSRGYLKTQFSWQWYYYTLTPEGLDYLREWLHLPAEIVPATHIKQQRSHAPPKGMMGGDDRERRPGGRGGPRGDRGDRGDREGGYRRRDAGEGKEGGVPGEFAPTFRGGFGRGRGAAPPS